MRIINSNSCFSGYAIVCGESVYINTTTGAGFCEIFELMNKTISTFASTITKCYPYNSFNDAKQDVCLMILEGIAKYDSKKGAALSTFLYTYISNKIIDIQKKKNIYFKYIDDIEELAIKYENLHIKLELAQRTEDWSDKWKEIIFRIFVNGDTIADVANDENITPWGLTRAIRRKLDTARRK